ncbi:B2 bradykinin receptor-like [Oncorhynchus tshawytscha]|uniref:B2 bradykinin receptor n=1 Tax=Oncorhynchus tshawytscha TaxID=74940 RepID=A0A8C8CGN8_ONCTS|nr:B2 bradykinin receptor-like [Oncorhynchus tshawytscha]
MFRNTTERLLPTEDPHSELDWTELDPYNCTLLYNYTAAWDWLSTYHPAYLVLLSVVGVLANGLVLYVFCLQRKLCTVADVYLGNLAAADLVIVSCLPFWAATIANSYHWAFGEPMCKLVNVAISMNYYCSVFFLVLVSVDRYLALVRPMCQSRLRRASWAKRICLGIWIMGFLLSLPILFFRKVKYVAKAGVTACYLAYPHPDWEIQRNITNNVVGFLLPVIVVAYCSRHIVIALKNGQIRKTPGVRSERKATQLVLTVLTVFLICWTPYQVVRFLDTLDYFQVTPGCLWGHILDISIQLSTYLAYANSAINPFLYVIVGRHFRKRAKEVFSTMLNRRLTEKSFLTVNFTSSGKLDTQRIQCKQLVKQTVMIQCEQLVKQTVT